MVSICFGPCFNHISPFACSLKIRVTFFENIGAVTAGNTFHVVRIIIFLPTNVHIFLSLFRKKLLIFCAVLSLHALDVGVPRGTHSWILYASKLHRFVMFCTFFNKLMWFDQSVVIIWNMLFLWFTTYIPQSIRLLRTMLNIGKNLHQHFPMSLFPLSPMSYNNQLRRFESDNPNNYSHL